MITPILQFLLTLMYLLFATLSIGCELACDFILDLQHKLK